MVHNQHVLLTLTASFIHFLEKGPLGGAGAGLFGLVVRPEVCGGTGPGGAGAGLCGLEVPATGPFGGAGACLFGLGVSPEARP